MIGFGLAQPRPEFDPRPLGALCALAAQRNKAADVDAYKKELADRFPEQAPKFIVECRP